jgi:cobalt-zinc-cadmium efflux system outer membrane protein
MSSTFDRIAEAPCVRTRARRNARGCISLAHLRKRRPTLLVVVALAGQLVVSGSVGAETTQELNLREAVDRALARNKQLAAFGFRIAEQEGRLEQAGLLPNPQVDLLFENIGGQNTNLGFESAETTLSIAWAIEPGLRGRRVGVERARSEQTQLDARILRLDVAAETAQHFLSCLETQSHLRATDEAMALSERTVAAVERRVRAGRAPNAGLLRARAELAPDRLARDDVSHERSVALHRLAAQWGETAPSFSRVEGDLLELPKVPGFDELAARIDRNPKLARLASEERVAEARLDLARARRWPTVTPNVGVRKFELTGDWALVAGLTVPFPVFDRNQGRVAESRAAVARTRADTESERVRVHTTLYEIYQEMQHSIHRAEVLRHEVIPRFEKTLVETQRGYEKGRYPYIDLHTVQVELLAARHSLVEAGTTAHRLVITLERLTGEGVLK